MRHSLTHGKEEIKMKIELNKQERRMIAIALEKAHYDLWNAALDGGKEERAEILEAIKELIALMEKFK